MDLTDNAEEEAFRTKVRAFLRDNLPAGWGRPGFQLPKGSSQLQFLKDWQRKLYEDGFLGMAWPREFGGQGSSQIEMAIFNEEMARHRAPQPLNVLGLSMAGPTIIVHGTDEQKQRYLSKILSPARRSGARDSPSPTRAPMWRRCGPAPSRAAMSSS